MLTNSDDGRDTIDTKVDDMQGGGNWADSALENKDLIDIDNVDCSYLPRPPVCEYGDLRGTGGGG